MKSALEWANSLSLELMVAGVIIDALLILHQLTW